MELFEYRRALHRIPETELDLPLTQKYIINALKGKNCEIILPIDCYVLAFFDYGKNETTALRADMDALEIEEKTGLDFASVNDGKMHACGHDGHMAMLLGVADMLNKTKAIPNTNVMLIFQPGEEAPGGAKYILDTDVFEKYNITKIFGMHLMPDLPFGTIATKTGGIMAQVNNIYVEFTGKAVHIASYQEGCDALYAATLFINEVYKKVDKLCEIEHKVLRFGKMQSGNVRNQVSDKTVLNGTIRSYSEKDAQTLRELVIETATQCAFEQGCKVNYKFDNGYPAVINDTELIKRLCQIEPKVKILDKPRMTAEDFSYYLQKVPGVYMFLGTQSNHELHSPFFNFDENVLSIGRDLYYKILMEF